MAGSDQFTDTFRNGATWVATADGLIRMNLGPWTTEDDGLEEAQFMQERFHALKKRLPAGRFIRAIVELKNIVNWDHAHLAMLRIYARMTRDPMTRRVAIVHATGMQKVLIVPLIKLVTRNREKLQFFDYVAAAEAWIAS